MRILKMRLVQTLVVETQVPVKDYDEFPVGPLSQERIDELESDAKAEAIAEGMTLEQQVTEAWVVDA